MSFNLGTFYRESLGVEYPASELDLTGVARNGDPEGVRALVQLLVGAAVSCGGKADYIQAIMQVRGRRRWERGGPGVERGGGGGGGQERERCMVVLRTLFESD